MTDQVPALWRHVLNATIGVTALFAAGLVLLPSTMQLLFLPMFYGVMVPPPELGPEAMRYAHFAFAMTGCIMLAWLMALAMVVNGPFRRGEPWAFVLVAGTIALWYVIDNICSWFMGYEANVAFNTAAVFPAALALARTWRCFFPRRAAAPAAAALRESA
ncbi:MAG: hypothetical protein TEF_05220 [Rhizobiales bacterium NRL2]|jgi:hypothetical protein|nr:MAG: hypothetical protein TEF_05220 [Rhizobiales bacterium NRL2]